MRPFIKKIKEGEAKSDAVIGFKITPFFQKFHGTPEAIKYASGFYYFTISFFPLRSCGIHFSIAFDPRRGGSEPLFSFYIGTRFF